jgi:hypothetical protein
MEALAKAEIKCPMRLRFRGMNGAPEIPDLAPSVLQLIGYGNISAISSCSSFSSFPFSSYVQGARVVQPPESGDGHSALEVWDFNVLPGQQEETRWSSRNNTSTKVAASLFREPLSTSLPYQAQVRMVKEEYGAFMIDEERIVALKVRTVDVSFSAFYPLYCFRSTL